MSLPFRGVIFDLDGTLVDSLGDIARAMNRALDEHDLPTHPLDAYPAFVGAGVRVLAERAVPEAQHEALDAIVAAFRRHYERHLVDHTVPYPGVEALLGELASRRVPMSILSNKYEAAVTRIVATLFPEVPFVEVRGQREAVPKKPNPCAALAIAERMAVEPGRCAFVGDTGIDMATAVRAEMIPVGVAWGFRDRDELLEAGARHLIGAAGELLRLDS